MNLEIINELKSKMDSYRPLSLEQIKEVERQKKLEHVWSSAAIEGNTLSKFETISILETGLTVSGKSIKDHLEIIDLSLAFDFIKDLSLNINDLDERTLREINRIVTLKTTDNEAHAGLYRVSNAYPKGYPNKEYTLPFLIKDEIEQYICWYNSKGKQEIIQ